LNASRDLGAPASTQLFDRALDSDDTLVSGFPSALAPVGAAGQGGGLAVVLTHLGDHTRRCGERDEATWTIMRSSPNARTRPMTGVVRTFDTMVRACGISSWRPLRNGCRQARCAIARSREGGVPRCRGGAAPYKVDPGTGAGARARPDGGSRSVRAAFSEAKRGSRRSRPVFGKQRKE